MFSISLTTHCIPSACLFEISYEILCEDISIGKSPSSEEMFRFSDVVEIQGANESEKMTFNNLSEANKAYTAVVLIVVFRACVSVQSSDMIWMLKKT